MKLWKYYKVPDDSDAANKHYDLYAFTNIKKYAMQFEEERDMSKFIKGSVVDIEENEYEDFRDSNQQLDLDLRVYESRMVDEDGKFGIQEVEILSTYDEFLNCSQEYSEELLFTEQLFVGVPSFKIFKHKLLKNLKKLEYVNMFKCLSSAHFEDDDVDYSAPDVAADEFAIFVRCYGSLFK